MTSCDLHPAIRNYIDIVQSGEHRVCPEQEALARYVLRCFETENLTVDTNRLDKYLGIAKYFPYKRLLPWEEFLIALWDCTYGADGLPRWSDLFAMLARGAGKDGFIANDGACSISPYNPVPHYDVDIAANCEDQAVRPVQDIVEMLETPQYAMKLNKFYYHTKELVQGRKNRGKIVGHANAPKNADGLRSGKVIFNEVHQYENYDQIKVYISGLGKVRDPRTGYLTSNGEISDGPLDDFLTRGERILFDGEPDNGFLPFICRLRSIDEVHDEANWYEANPSLAYFPSLLSETRKQYRDWLEHPEQNGNFLSKRMGLRAGFTEISVTDREKVTATAKPLPDLRGWACVVGIDYAELSDWASIVYHFRRGNDRFDICHTWLCLKSKTLSRVKAPWKDWAGKGYVTAVDDVSISPELLAEDIRQMGRIYQIKKIAMDNFRWTLVSDAFRKIGFDASDKTRVKLVRPSDIMTVDPIIQECFDRGYFHWGDCPPLRWAVSNTKRVPASRKSGSDTGNFYYAKIEAKSRKTDMFMALVAAMIVEPALGGGQTAAVPKIGAIKL